MGLIYLFPTHQNEADYVIIENEPKYKKITIKSYGLPWIFWVYAAAILTLLAILVFSVTQPLLKLYSMASTIDLLLIYAFCLTMVMVVFLIVTFLYWQIHIVITKEKLTVEYRPFGIKVFSKGLNREEALQLDVVHFMDTPNVARLEQNQLFKDFQNKGHFELIAWNTKDKILVDRSNRKQDLEDLKYLINLPITD